MKVEIKVLSGKNIFAEDKDAAREIRVKQILPTLKNSNNVILDFSSIRYATQSFIHALIGEALKQYGEDALDRIEFRHCSPQLRNIIGLVVDYSLGGFKEPQSRK